MVGDAMKTPEKPSWVLAHELLAERYGGFAYSWKSQIGPGNGEEAYTRLVEEHLAPGLEVVEAGCGHGLDALGFAPRVRRYLGYDAVEPFVRTARAAAAARGLSNVEFVVADSSPKRGGRIPAPDGSADLILSRRGPSNFILDAKRVCRPGATLIQLCNVATPVPAWNDALPEELRLRAEPETVPGSVHRYLEQAGIPLDGAWSFDVPEHFAEPRELYERLVWSREDPPAETTVLRAIERLFARDPRPALRHRRFLWKARIGA